MDAHTIDISGPNPKPMRISSRLSMQLSGWAATCSCGWVISGATSVTEAARLAQQHVDTHAS